MREAAQLEQLLAGLANSDAVDVYDGGRLQPHLAKFQYELRQQQEKLLLHLWTEDGNLVRRVLGLVEISGDYVALEVARFGQAKPGRLEFVRRTHARDGARMTREKFRRHFRPLLEQQFPDEKVELLTTARDLQHSFSGSYVRGLMRQGKRAWAVMGVASTEAAAIQDSILSFGLLWLDWMRSHSAGLSLAGLRLFVPRGGATTTAHRMRALASSVRVELFEVDEAQWRVSAVDVEDAGNIDTWLTPRREVDRALATGGETIQRVRNLAPEAIEVVAPPGTKAVALRFRGLEFARWQAGALEFGLDERRQTLTKANWKSLERLVGRLARYRNPDARDVNHALYRAQPERWLESLLVRDPTRVDAHLNPACVYSQVPAFSAGDRGVLDLLGARRDGRLVVMEVKASEDIHLVLQAADYWLRVRAHHQRGEFAQYGYFRGVELQDGPPVLCLIAPGFRFHPSTDIILRCLSPEIEVQRIGLNEGWRQGIQVVFRH